MFDPSKTHPAADFYSTSCPENLEEIHVTDKPVLLLLKFLSSMPYLKEFVVRNDPATSSQDHYKIR